MKKNETEMTVLSMLINYNNVFDDVCDKLIPELFIDEQLKLIFVELRSQILSGQGCDVVSLYQSLNGVVPLDTLHIIGQYHDHGTRALSKHIDHLQEQYKSHQLHGIATLITELAYEDIPVDHKIDKAQVAFQKITDVYDNDEWVDAYTASVAHTLLLEKRHEGLIQGIPTGFEDFDDMLDGGLQRGNLVIIGARPAMGKTAFAMNIGLNIAKHHTVGFLSMEMAHNDVRDRQAAILSRASISAIKRPSRGLEYDKIVEGVEKSRHLRFFVSDKSGLNILNIRSKARALKRKQNLDVLIVDYIGLMSGLNPKMMRAYQIEEISRGLKDLAKELDIVVVCLAQVNRGGVQSPHHSPGLQDLRDSGAIEQDADVVAFIHRPIAQDMGLGLEFQNYAKLDVKKNRQGRIGEFHLFYEGDYTTFSKWTGDIPTEKIKRGSYEL